MTVRCPYDFIGPARALCGNLAGSLRLSQESTIIFGQNDNLKPCVVLTITVWCPHGDRTMSLRCVYGLRAYDFFSNLSLCGIKQYRRSHDVRKSIRWSQGLPAAAHGNGDLHIVSANDVKISVDRQKQYLSIYIRLWYCKFYICRDTCTARFCEYKNDPRIA